MDNRVLLHCLPSFDFDIRNVRIDIKSKRYSTKICSNSLVAGTKTNSRIEILVREVIEYGADKPSILGVKRVVFKEINATTDDIAS